MAIVFALDGSISLKAEFLEVTLQCSLESKAVVEIFETDNKVVYITDIDGIFLIKVQLTRESKLEQVRMQRLLYRRSQRDERDEGSKVDSPVESLGC
jgi:hypothetical protein